MLFFQRKEKRWMKITSAVVAIFLLATLFRTITERIFLAQASIAGAFSTLAPEESRGTITLTGRYLPPPYGFSEKKLLSYFAEEIGLLVDGEIREVDFEGRVEHVYEKEAAQAHSIVKVVYLTEPEEYYLCAEITLFGKSATTIAEFRTQMTRGAKKLTLEEVTTTMELCGIYSGEIPLASKDALTDKLLYELLAQPVYENRENANYTVYAYTGAEEDYIMVEKKKINVQVAIYYDNDSNQTEVVLASPIGLR